MRSPLLCASRIPPIRLSEYYSWKFSFTRDVLFGPRTIRPKVRPDWTSQLARCPLMDPWGIQKTLVFRRLPVLDAADRVEMRVTGALSRVKISTRYGEVGGKCGERTTTDRPRRSLASPSPLLPLANLSFVFARTSPLVREVRASLRGGRAGGSVRAFSIIRGRCEGPTAARPLVAGKNALFCSA